jgi:hypothetical protein
MGSVYYNNRSNCVRLLVTVTKYPDNLREEGFILVCSFGAFSSWSPEQNIMQILPLITAGKQRGRDRSRV